MATQNQTDLFDAYFKRADLDRDGRISGAEAVGFFQGSNLPKQVLAQIWMYADRNRTGFLGRAEFYNALKLVTVAQSKRELTPEIVKSALYSPASAQIPAPQINLAGISAPHSNPVTATPPAPQLGTVASTPQNPGFRGTPVSQTTNMNQQTNHSPVSGLVRPPNNVPAVASRPAQGVGFQGFAGGGASHSLNIADSRGSSGGGGTTSTGGSLAMLQEGGRTSSTTQSGLPSGTPGPAALGSLSPRPPVASGMAPLGNHTMQPRPPVSQNGFPSGSFFEGNAYLATPSQTKKDDSVPTLTGGIPVSSAIVPVSRGTTATMGSLDSVPNSSAAPHVHPPLQKPQAPVRPNQQMSVPNLPPSGPRAASSHISTGHQPQWPRPNPTDLQKYNKVFMEVDTDKDGKITGEEARNLFLSWRLPREVLKQVWDLSDQDNDSMLSLREFCIALYLMERYREGRPLPATLPSSIMLDFPVTSQQTAGYGKATSGYAPGLQPQAVPASGARPPRPAGKPPLPVPATFSDDRVPPKQQKAKIPVLEKHLVDQLGEEEQKSLNMKFQDASEANKKVEGLEKEIKEAREKMEFYRVKMQEIVLYKSRCDSRFNEVSERAATDKSEVESLAKKYEEKYRQTGNVASKLTMEEATFRDIQEKKMEMYQAIVKLELDGTGEDLQVRADRVQSSLEGLVKSLSERCKTYGLRAKPTSLVELPFGWQPGIQGSAADWDEVWDKFDEEGFSFVKELTLDVQNVIAPPRSRAKVAKKEKNLVAEVETTSLTSDAKSKPLDLGDEDKLVAENGVTGNQKEDVNGRSPVDSPSARSSQASPRKASKDNHFGSTGASDASPLDREAQSDFRALDAPLSGDKRSDELAWGTFDTNGDADSSLSSFKEMDRGKLTDDLFGHGAWTLPPIKTSTSPAGGFLPKMSVFADSVPGTPADGFLPKKSVFADSVPGTPADGFLPKRSVFADSVPGTPADGFMPKKSIFADSVPSTPLFSSSYSPKKSGEGTEENGISFSRFDSFRSSDSGFQPHEMLSRFDSFRSTADFDSQDSAQFQQKETLSRFDSMQSTTDFGHGRFSSFDDSDPFGSGPFKSSFGSETPRGEDTFTSSDPFKSYLGSETPRSEVDPFGSVSPFRSSFGSETPRSDSDAFGSGGPFRSSWNSETPRAEADPFGSVGPFSSSFGNETPRGGESDYFAQSGSFKSSFGNETPRGGYDSFGVGGPKSSFGNETPRGGYDSFGVGGAFGSSLGSETPRQDSDAFGSVGPFKSSVGSETPKGGTWSAF